MESLYFNSTNELLRLCLTLSTASLIIYQNFSYFVFPCSGITGRHLIFGLENHVINPFSPASRLKNKISSDWKLPWTSSRYICQEVRKKFSASSDQTWRVADGCNVTRINSSKSELKRVIMIRYKMNYALYIL